MVRLIVTLLLCFVAESTWAIEDDVPQIQFADATDSKASILGNDRLESEAPSVLSVTGDCDASCVGGSCCEQCSRNPNCCFGSLCDPTCRQRNWVDVDGLLFFSRGFRVPALVAQSAAGTPRAQVGILGDPATNVVLGNERLGDEVLFGARIELGHWLDGAGSTAIVGSLFGFSDAANHQFPTDPNTIISRPFFNVSFVHSRYLGHLGFGSNG